MSGAEALHLFGVLLGAWLLLMAMMFLLEWMSNTR